MGLSEQRRNGFTVVELLIVIVVIGVLAGISVVAYNGIQERARNSSLLSSVDAIEKAATVHQINYGMVPLTYNTDTSQYVTEGNRLFSCIGKLSDYPANSDFAVGECYKDGGQVFATVDTAVNNQFASVVKNLSVDSSNVITGPNNFATRGIIYYAMGGSSASEGVIMYYQKSDRECGRGLKTFYTNEDLSAGFEAPDGITICQTLVGD